MDDAPDDRPEPQAPAHPQDQDFAAVSPELEAILASAPPPPARRRPVVVPANRHVVAFRAAAPRRRRPVYVIAMLAVGLAGLAAGLMLSRPPGRTVAPAPPQVPPPAAAPAAPTPAPSPVVPAPAQDVEAAPEAAPAPRLHLRAHVRRHRALARHAHKARPKRPRPVGPRVRWSEAEAATAALNNAEPRPRRGYPFEVSPGAGTPGEDPTE